MGGCSLSETISANSTCSWLTRFYRCLSCKEHIACLLALMPLGSSSTRVSWMLLTPYLSQRGCFPAEVDMCCRSCEIFLRLASFGHFMGCDSPVSVALLLQAGVPLRLLQRAPPVVAVCCFCCAGRCSIPYYQTTMCPPFQSSTTEEQLLPTGVLRWRSGQGGPAEAVRYEPSPCHNTTPLNVFFNKPQVRYVLCIDAVGLLF